MTVDAEGQLTPSFGYSRLRGLEPGARFVAESFEDGLRLHRIRADARKAYLEVTARCNLDCAVCVRQVWSDPAGDMAWETFEATVEGLHAFPDLRRLVLGGYGEPLVHPRFPEMLGLASTLGVPLTVTTNGLLLDETMARHLLAAPVNWVVISLDTVHAQAYDGAGIAGGLDLVLDNARRLVRLAEERRGLRLNLGFEFVATRSNRNHLPRVRDVARDLGAAQVLVSNLLPYTEAMCDEILYDSEEQLSLPLNWPTNFNYGLVWGQVDLPRMKWGAWQQCRFVDDRAVVIGWDGGVSPCYPLMHSYPYYIYGRRKNVSRYVLGNVNECSLADIWQSQEYVCFRAKVRDFRFMYCVDCGAACDYAESNEDCLGNVPSCADCLWAQGIVRCP
jgi:tungsten cofactor oxidoreducase radical SAM maturase